MKDRIIIITMITNNYNYLWVGWANIILFFSQFVYDDDDVTVDVAVNVTDDVTVDVTVDVTDDVTVDKNE